MKAINTRTFVYLSKIVNTCKTVGVSLPLTVEQTSCCAPSGGAGIDATEADRIAQVFKALGDPTRVRLLSLIAAGEGGEACICDLTDPVGLSQGTVSHHMKLLANAGLVTREQRGRWAYFTIADGALEAAAALLRAL